VLPVRDDRFADRFGLAQCRHRTGLPSWSSDY
jgi:hypothetical protein